MVGSWLDAESHIGDRVYNGFCCLRDSTQLSSGVSRSTCMSRIVLVRHGPSAHVAEARLLDHAALILDLERLLKRPVDVASERGLRPLVRKDVLKDAVAL